MLIAHTYSPQQLLDALITCIDTGELKSWHYDEDGDLSHTSDRWANLAWMRPAVRTGKLVFTIVPPRERPISTQVYAAYHSLLISALLQHCDELFRRVEATAMPAGTDKVKAEY